MWSPRCGWGNLLDAGLPAASQGHASVGVHPPPVETLLNARPELHEFLVDRLQLVSRYRFEVEGKDRPVLCHQASFGEADNHEGCCGGGLDQAGDEGPIMAAEKRLEVSPASRWPQYVSQYVSVGYMPGRGGFASMTSRTLGKLVCPAV